jgi:hypothetical protein
MTYCVGRGAGLVLPIVVFILLGPAGTAHAATVDCGKGDKIGSAIAAAGVGERIVIRGTCRENVIVPPSAYGLILEGEDNASIAGPDPAKPVILVLGRESRDSAPPPC